MTDALVAERLRARCADEAAAAIRSACEPLPPPERSDDFAALFDRYGDARVVLLGEATHGTSEFYCARGAGHVFEEPGTLDQVVAHATAWFRRHLGGQEREL